MKIKMWKKILTKRRVIIIISRSLACSLDPSLLLFCRSIIMATAAIAITQQQQQPEQVESLSSGHLAILTNKLRFQSSKKNLKVASLTIRRRLPLLLLLLLLTFPSPSLYFLLLHLIILLTVLTSAILAVAVVVFFKSSNISDIWCTQKQCSHVIISFTFFKWTISISLSFFSFPFQQQAVQERLSFFFFIIC